MPRNGSPQDPHHSDAPQDPTQYANYGGSSSQAYSDYAHDQPGYGQPGHEQPGYGQLGADTQAAASTWHRKPAVLIGLGVLTAVVLAFLVYAVVKFVGVDTSGPAVTPGTSATSSVTTTGADTGGNTATSIAPSTAGTTETVTETQTPTTSAAPTTTAPPTSSSTITSTTTSVTTSTSTVTVTTSRAPWTLPTLFPRPKEDG
ncbi:MAG: hypothetical protein U0R81_15045 [Mycobacterium sp.]